MITSADEFRQRLLEIQNNTKITNTTLPSTEQRFLVDANTRTINVPSEFGFLGVQNDHRAETIYFEIDRYFDSEDFSKHTCVIQFINSKNEGAYPVTSYDLTTVDGKIIFGWTIGNDATQINGDIEFAIRFYTIDQDYKFLYNYNTLSAKSKILNGMNIKNSTQINITPSETQVFVSRISDINNEVSLKLDTMDAMNSSMREYIDEAKASFGKFAVFSIESDGVLYADVNDEYGVEDIAIGDNGDLVIYFRE